MPLPMFGALIFSKGKQYLSRNQFCVPWRPYLPECPKDTKDYNSQNSPCRQHTWLPAVPQETAKAMATLPGALVWFHSLLAPQQGEHHCLESGSYVVQL